MTGWRIGWIGAPQSCWQKIENLVQYSTSGVAVFMQRAAMAALDEGHDFSETVIEDARIRAGCVPRGHGPSRPLPRITARGRILWLLRGRRILIPSNWV
jgi:hypothetical protein